MASCIASRAAAFFSSSLGSTAYSSNQAGTCKVAFWKPSVKCSAGFGILPELHAHLEKPSLISTTSSFVANTLPKAGIAAAHSFCQSPILSCRASGVDILEEVKKKNRENAIIVYSKSWCPYCRQVKGLFKDLRVPHKVIELDELNEEMEVQDALYQLTRQTTVPNVFIGGKHIGGCDDTLALKSNGKLFELLTAAGVNVPSS